MQWGLFFSILLSLCFYSCSNQSRRPLSVDRKELHVVFDIDWTTVYGYEAGISHVSPDKILWVEGKGYIVRPNMIETVEFLISKGIHVSFFSGGTSSRNNELLSKIKMKDGQSFSEIAYNVRSFEDLQKIEGVPETAKFPEKFKKDLLKIHEDLHNIVLIDDVANFYFGNEQKENLNFLGPAYKYFENFEATKENPGMYVPKNYEEWLFDRYKMVLIQEYLREAINLVEEEKITLKEAMLIVGHKMDLASGVPNLYTRPILDKAIALTSQLHKSELNREPCIKLLESMIVHQY